jgi:2-dehydro-3-deoxy-D-gluconate 5-dehydrogenase
LAIARRLGEAGARLLMTDVNAVALDRAAQDLKALGFQVKTHLCDVSQESDITALFEYTDKNLDGIDILVNNAGIFPFVPVLDMDSAMWDKVLDVNLRGTFLCSRECARRMVAGKRKGVIVNISSMNAVRPSSIGTPHYDASKGGVNSLTRSMALELAPNGIRVVAVGPGMIWSDGVRSSASQAPDAEALSKALEAKIPRGRYGHPDDIARVVLFLASDAGAHITGTTVYVDGGCLCYF